MSIALDENLVNQVRNPLWQVWNAIAWDIQQCMEGEPPLTGDEIIETCMDANHLTTYGFPEADKLLSDAYMEHGDKLYKFLDKHLRFSY